MKPAIGSMRYMQVDLLAALYIFIYKVPVTTAAVKITPEGSSPCFHSSSRAIVPYVGQP